MNEQLKSVTKKVSRTYVSRMTEKRKSKKTRNEKVTRRCGIKWIADNWKICVYMSIHDHFCTIWVLVTMAKMSKIFLPADCSKYLTAWQLLHSQLGKISLYDTGTPFFSPHAFHFLIVSYCCKLFCLSLSSLRYFRA